MNTTHFCKLLTATSLMLHAYTRTYIRMCRRNGVQHFHDQQKFMKFTKIYAREKTWLYGISNSRLIPLALAWSPESELDIHSPPSPSSGVEGGRLLEYTNRLLDSCIDPCISQTQRKVSHTHTHTHTYLCSLSSSYILHLLPVLRVSCEHVQRGGAWWALFGMRYTL